VKRIGHGVMATPKVVETARWFREILGFICSDDVYAGSKDNIIARSTGSIAAPPSSTITCSSASGTSAPA